jgi:hypothetical protein
VQINPEYKVFLFDKDSTLVVNGTPLNAELHKEVFLYFARHPQQIAWGMVSTGGGEMSFYASEEEGYGESGIQQDATGNLNQFRKEILQDGYTGGNDPRRALHFCANYYRRDLKQLSMHIVVPDALHLAAEELTPLLEYGTLQGHDPDYSLSMTNRKGEKVCYKFKVDTYATLKCRHGIEIVLNLKLYLENRELHIKGDNKLFQALDGMASAKIAVIPGKEMHALGIMDVLAPADFIRVYSHQIFGLDDKEECVNVWRKGGLSAAVANTREAILDCKKEAAREKTSQASFQHHYDTEQAEQNSEKIILKCKGAVLSNLLATEAEYSSLQSERVDLERRMEEANFMALKREKQLQQARKTIEFCDKILADESQMGNYAPALLQHMGNFESLDQLKKRNVEDTVRLTQAKGIRTGLIAMLKEKYNEVDDIVLKESLKNLILDLELVSNYPQICPRLEVHVLLNYSQNMDVRENDWSKQVLQAINIHDKYLLEISGNNIQDYQHHLQNAADFHIRAYRIRELRKKIEPDVLSELFTDRSGAIAEPALRINKALNRIHTYMDGISCTNILVPTDETIKDILEFKKAAEEGCNQSRSKISSAFFKSNDAHARLYLEFLDEANKMLHALRVLYPDRVKAVEAAQLSSGKSLQQS